MFSEKIHYPVTLGVNQDGAGGVASTQAEVVYTQQTHILLIGTESLSDTLQEGIRAYDEAQLACEPRACFAAQSKSDPLQRLPLAVGGASVEKRATSSRRSAKSPRSSSRSGPTLRRRAQPAC